VKSWEILTGWISSIETSGQDGKRELKHRKGLICIDNNTVVAYSANGIVIRKHNASNRKNVYHSRYYSHYSGDWLYGGRQNSIYW
jgi:hypothetical protein